MPNLDYVLNITKPKNIRKNPILIFDDIERFTADNFSLFLGYLYKLNLQGARIICITSSEKLNGKKEVFDEYKEKIFDVIYKIDEPSLDVFENVFQNVRTNEIKEYLLEKCDKNIRILRKADLLFNRVVQETSDTSNWIIDEFFVDIACCHAIRIVLEKMQNDSTSEDDSYAFKMLDDEFGDNIATNYLILTKSEKFTDSERIIPSLIKSLLRVYLFNDFHDLKAILLPQKEKKGSILNQSFFLLSDENKKLYVSLFSQVIKNPQIQYDKKYINMFADIIRYYQEDIDQSLIDAFVNKYFDACNGKNEIESQELVFFLKSIEEDTTSMEERAKLSNVICAIQSKLEKLQLKANTEKLLNALKTKNTVSLSVFNERFGYLEKWIDKTQISDFLIQNGFCLPNLANNISQDEWSFSHQICTLIHLLKIDESFIEYAKKQVKDDNSNCLRTRLEALIYYKLNQKISL